MDLGGRHQDSCIMRLELLFVATILVAKTPRFGRMQARNHDPPKNA